MAGVRVEPATTEDLDALADLWVALVDDQRDHGAHLLAEPNRETARDLLGQYVVADSVSVARFGGEVVGFVMFHVESGLYEQDTTRGVIDNVYVRAAARGEGVGSALLDHAEDDLAEEGADVFALSVMAANEDAQRLYRERGYHQHRIVLEKPAENDTHSKEGHE